MAEIYDTGDAAREAEFIERIAARLGAPERVRPAFARRLMQRIRAEGAAQGPADAIERAAKRRPSTGQKSEDAVDESAPE